MSYLALLKDIVASEVCPPDAQTSTPTLKLIINRPKEVRDDVASASSNCPLNSERNLVEVVQWRVAALERVRRRRAGQIPDWPLSKQDAAVYERLIEQRCKRLGLSIEAESHRDLSVLSVPGVRVFPEIVTGKLDLPSSSALIPVQSAETCKGDALTKLTKGD